MGPVGQIVQGGAGIAAVWDSAAPRVCLCDSDHLHVLQEAEIFKELVLSDTSKALTHIFFAQRSTTKVGYRQDGIFI